MEIKDYLNWGNVPEFVLENFWHLDITDNDTEAPSYTEYLTEDMMDLSISEITFPQEEISFEKTTFGLPILTGIEEYSNVSISYFDYVKSSVNNTSFPVTTFFQDWMDSLYDREKRCVRNRWRHHSKTIEATLSRYFKKGPASSFAQSVASYGIGIANTYANPLGFRTGVNIGNPTFDIQEEVVAKYKIENCYITKLSEISLSNDGGDRKEFSAELICERVTPLFSTEELSSPQSDNIPNLSLLALRR